MKDIRAFTPNEIFNINDAGTWQVATKQDLNGATQVHFTAPTFASKILIHVEVDSYIKFSNSQNDTNSDNDIILSAGLHTIPVPIRLFLDGDVYLHVKATSDPGATKYVRVVWM